MADAPQTDCYRVPNPAYKASDFVGDPRRNDIDALRGIAAEWDTIAATGHLQARTFTFAKDLWPSIETCQAWVSQNRFGFEESGMNARLHETFEAQYIQRATDSEPTDDEYSIIQTLTLKPIQREELYVREMRLTNDQWGKHNVRLSRGFQQRLMATLPGKALLMGHPEARGVPAIPEGMFFAATEERDAETGVTWGITKFYLCKTTQNEHMRKQIDAGVWKYASIGFSVDERICSICGRDIYDMDCSHIPGHKYSREDVRDLDLDPQIVPEDPEKVYCGIIFRGRGEAHEGSIVYWPELNGTQIVADADGAAVEQQAVFMRAHTSGDFGRAKALLLAARDKAPLASEDAMPTHDGEGAPDDTEGSGSDASATGNLASDAPSTTAKVVTQMADTPDPKVAELEATLSAQKTELETLKAKLAETETALKTAQQAAETQKTELEALQARETAFRADIVGDVERLSVLLKHEAVLAAFQSGNGEKLEGMTPETLFALRDEWTKTAEGLAGDRQSTPGAADADTGNDDEDADDETFEVPSLRYF